MNSELHLVFQSQFIDAVQISQSQQEILAKWSFPTRLVNNLANLNSLISHNVATDFDQVRLIFSGRPAYRKTQFSVWYSEKAKEFVEKNKPLKTSSRITYLPVFSVEDFEILSSQLDLQTPTYFFVSEDEISLYKSKLEPLTQLNDLFHVVADHAESSQEWNFALRFSKRHADFDQMLSIASDLHSSMGEKVSCFSSGHWISPRKMKWGSHLEKNELYYTDSLLQNRKARPGGYFFFEKESWSYFNNENELIQVDLPVQPTSTLYLDALGKLTVGKPAGWEPGPMTHGKGKQPLLHDLVALVQDTESENKHAQQCLQLLIAQTKGSEFGIKGLQQVEDLLKSVIQELSFYIHSRFNLQEASLIGYYCDTFPKYFSIESLSVAPLNKTTTELRLGQCLQSWLLPGQILSKDNLIIATNQDNPEQTYHRLKTLEDIRKYCKTQADELVMVQSPQSGVCKSGELLLHMNLGSGWSLLQILNDFHYERPFKLPPLVVTQKQKWIEEMIPGIAAAARWPANFRTELDKALKALQHQVKVFKNYLEEPSSQMTSLMTKQNHQEWLLALSSGLSGDDRIQFEVENIGNFRVLANLNHDRVRFEISVVGNLQMKVPRESLFGSAFSALKDHIKFVKSPNSAILETVEMALTPNENITEGASDLESEPMQNMRKVFYEQIRFLLQKIQNS